jgi:WhiB family transcriptional regulator, redox-sensing transcriptional regulator
VVAGLGSVRSTPSVADGHWIQQARCAQSRERWWWFPDSPEDAQRAIAVCETCPVKDPCLSFALASADSETVRGGTTPKERLAMLRMGKTAQ